MRHFCFAVANAHVRTPQNLTLGQSNMLRSAVRSTRRAGAACQQQQQMRKLSQMKTPSAAVFSKQSSSSPVISQAMYGYLCCC